MKKLSFISILILFCYLTVFSQTDKNQNRSGGDPIPLDQFSISATRINKVKLNSLLTQLQSNPATKAYIVEIFERKTSRNVINLKLQKLDDYLFKARKFQKDRIVILIGAPSEVNSTQLYIAPFCAAPPEIQNKQVN